MRYYHRIIVENNRVILERDQGEHSCGESRNDWRTMKSWDKRDFLRDVVNMFEKNSYISLGDL